jgi:SAM-dependent methyltransferase
MTVDSTVRLREAFEMHATSYDRVFGENPLALEMRRRTWRVFDGLFPPGSHVLDLGCGTGDDALHLARRGVSVRAVDLAGNMLARVREKAEREGVERLVECSVGDCASLSLGDVKYDGIYSNFGALNCVSDVSWIARQAPGLLHSGAPLVLVLMGSLYPLELAVNLMKGRLGQAFRRWGSAPTARVEGVDIDVHYHGLGQLRRALQSRFDLEHSEALNLFMPVPGLDHVGRRYRRAFDRLQPVDRWLSSRWPLSTVGDHFITVWRLRPERT